MSRNGDGGRQRRRRTCASLMVFAALVVAAGCVSAIRGVRLEKVPTRSMPAPVAVLVVTPPSYDSSPGRRYPVLYFLHDAYGDGRTLQRRGVAAEALARMRDGRLPEFLLVAPDGPGTWFSDAYDGAHRYEEFLTGDLPRWVDARYRTLPGQASRGITGISMGGYGSVKTALKHPDLYGSVSALSGAIIPFGWDDLPRYSVIARFTLKRVFGRSKDRNSLDANDAWSILRTAHFATPPFAVELRAGNQDDYALDGVAAQFGMLLNENGVPTTVVLEPGRHDWSYWGPAMMEILAWHGARFEYDRR